MRELRSAYPDSSYNCMIQSRDQLIVLEAHNDSVSQRDLQGVTSVYAQYGRADEAKDYRTIHYRAITRKQWRAEGRARGKQRLLAACLRRVERSRQQHDARGFEPHRRFPHPFHLTHLHRHALRGVEWGT